LDGTLVDSFPGIKISLLHALRNDLPNRKFKITRDLIGPPVKRILKNIVTDETEEVLQHLETCFREHYNHIGCKKITLYPNIGKTLAELSSLGVRFHIITNKPEIPTRSIVKIAQWESLFDDVISPDSRTPPFDQKEDAINYLLSKWDLKHHETIMVGDTISDEMAALAAGIRFIGVTYGYGSFDRSADLTNGNFIDDFYALVDLIKKGNNHEKKHF